MFDVLSRLGSVETSQNHSIAVARTMRYEFLGLSSQLVAWVENGDIVQNLAFREVIDENIAAAIRQCPFFPELINLINVKGRTFFFDNAQQFHEVMFQYAGLRMSARDSEDAFEEVSRPMITSDETRPRDLNSPPNIHMAPPGRRPTMAEMEIPWDPPPVLAADVDAWGGAVAPYVEVAEVGQPEAQETAAETAQEEAPPDSFLDQ
jgi:hypothetical protein